ncbi:hypothetical protein ACHAXS_011723 [Conticribra weissflogii]
MSDSQESNQSSPQQTISFTRRRTTTKTRTPASTARRRKNIPLVHASGRGDGHDNNADGKDKYSWFARKSAGWTDEEIKRHLTSGGTSAGGGSGVSFVGDVIVGGSDANGNEKKKRRRRNIPMFTWEEEDQIDNKFDLGMKSAPTIFDIMDDQDKVDFMAPVQVGEKFRYNSIGSGSTSSKKPNNRQIKTNAALAELAQVSGQTNNLGVGAPTSANESIGWRLLRIWGYRQRLGVAIVPLRGKKVDADAMSQLLENDDQKFANFETKWLSRKGLRVIQLPSTQSVSDDHKANDHTKHQLNLKNDDDITRKNDILTIPPPKLNRHGIEYDPFRNAPEFRAFHDRRRALALERGRAIEKENNSKNGDQKGANRYFTDSVGKDAHPWKLGDAPAGLRINNRFGDISDGDADECCFAAKAKSQNAHYAAEDNNFADFIGTKASSGFALEDEDDANVYQDDEHDFNRVRKGRMMGAESSEYELEVQSPLASEDETSSDFGGLFDSFASSAGGKLNVKVGRKNRRDQSGHKASRDEDKELEDAWSQWGKMGNIDKKSDNKAIVISAPGHRKTNDGKPPLPGFQLSDEKEFMNSNKRWKGPSLPSGYVLKRHIFLPSTQNSKIPVFDSHDSAPGLDLRPNRATIARVPQVLPSSGYSRVADQSSSLDRKQLNFDAVKESMKNRFVPSSGETINNIPDASAGYDRDGNEKDNEEWVTATTVAWLPSRLLCKRWGLPFPSSTNPSVSKDSRETGITGEEEYFRETVLEPAVEVDRKHRDLKSLPNRNDEIKKVSKSQCPVKIEPYGVEDDAIPIPNRPPTKLFRSIFDADSDSSLFLSDNEDSLMGNKLVGDNNETTRMSPGQEPQKNLPPIPQQSEQGGDISNAIPQWSHDRNKSKSSGLAGRKNSTNPAPDRDKRSPDLSSTSVGFSSEDDSRRISRKSHRRSGENREDDNINCNVDKKEKRSRSSRRRRHRGYNYSTDFSYDSNSDNSKSEKKPRREKTSRSSEKRKKKRKKERRH